MRHSAIVRCILWTLLSGTAASALGQGVSLGVSINIAPPPLPVYQQPAVPGPNYLWTPGYWAWGSDGYYWVPGTWVLAPQPGLMWTPGYWDWIDGAYVWQPGYWAPEVGFYGGVDYGFGYNGTGFYGGYWRHGAFYYNRAVNNLGGRRFATVYDRPVPRRPAARVSYHGGSGGIQLRATPQQQNIAHSHHFAATAAQQQHQRAASTNRALMQSVNHGAPPIAATPRAGVFSGNDVVSGKAGATAHAQRTQPRTRIQPQRHPSAAERGNVGQEQPRHPPQHSHRQPEPARQFEPGRPNESERPIEPERQTAPAQREQPQHQGQSKPGEPKREPPRRDNGSG